MCARLYTYMYTYIYMSVCMCVCVCALTIHVAYIDLRNINTYNHIQYWYDI